MPLHEVSLDSLQKLDMGKAYEAFQTHIRRAAIDCMDRPGDPKPRKVELHLALVPVIEPDGTCDEVKAQFHVTSKVPSHRTKIYSFGLRRNGSLVFSEDSPDAIDQATMFEEEEN